MIYYLFCGLIFCMATLCNFMVDGTKVKVMEIIPLIFSSLLWPISIIYLHIKRTKK